MNESIKLTVNGQAKTLACDPATPLLYALREECSLTGTHFGCGLNQCGACFVLVDGRPVASCDTPVWSVAGKAVVTVEGLGTPERPHALQTAFIQEQAMQCGYCISGMLITAAALLAKTPDPGEQTVREALDGNLCRCGAHNRIVRAVMRAAKAGRRA
jgi:nicotinate dehydrogenase subunit A